jgi:hypothetical protein
MRNGRCGIVPIFRLTSNCYATPCFALRVGVRVRTSPAHPEFDPSIKSCSASSASTL